MNSNLTEVQKAWFAGFFDADGSITINNVSLATSIVLQKADSYILDTFRDSFGGGSFQQPNSNPGWLLNGEKAASFLEIILPYLRLKKVEAQVGLEYRRRRPNEQDKQDFTEKCKTLLSTLRYTVRNLEPLDFKKDTSAAYLAGHVDGDGSIVIVRNRNQRSFVYIPHVALAGHISSIIEMEQLQKTYGGSVYTKPNSHSVVWRVGSRRAEVFLKMITPFLILKQKQAKLVLEFYEAYDNLPYHTNEKLAIGEKYQKLISDLNQRYTTEDIE